jgi:hypothetical protein
MLRLQMALYLLASLLFAWSGGWLFTHDYPFAVVVCCALWAALTTWMLVSSLRAVFRSGSPGSGSAETGADYL